MKVRNFRIFTPIMVAALISTTATYSIDKNWCRNVVLVDRISIAKEQTKEKQKDQTKETTKEETKPMTKTKTKKPMKKMF